jgi:prepilin-type N-terminal cleavage/methylation domain-containing protein
MKVLNEKKGFTLIELLAVIVVLAIVMVLAVSTVLPYIAKSKKNAFAIEANTVLDAAQSAISLIQVDIMSDTGTSDIVSYTKTSDTATSTTYCFTLQDLINIGTLNSKKMTASGTKYSGKVEITVPKSSGYKYDYYIWFKNANYYVENNEGTVDLSAVNVMDDTHSSKTYPCQTQSNP